VTAGLKFTVRRTRPDESSRTSFPSGHTSGAFATATVLKRRYGWKAGIPAYGAASFISLSRLNENKHYLSDIVFGAAVGFMAGRTVTIDRGRTHISLSPMAAPGGAGIQFTLTRD
jgi:membrane-associated phospholipid phosphatase